MKENRAFRILFITKKQLKSIQALHSIFLKHQYKVSQSPGQNQQMVNSFVYHPCPSRLVSRLILTFIISKKSSLVIRINFKQFHTLVHIANCSVHLHYMYIINCNDFEHFCVQLLLQIVFLKIFLLTSSGDGQCIWCFTLFSCYMYRVPLHIIYAATKLLLDFYFIFEFTIVIFILFF